MRQNSTVMLSVTMLSILIFINGQTVGVDEGGGRGTGEGNKRYFYKGDANVFLPKS